MALVEADPYLHKDRKMSLGIRLLRRWICQQFEMFLTNGTSGARFLEAELGVSRERIMQRPFLVSEPGGVAGAAESDSATAPDLSASTIKFLVVGQLIDRKGPMALLDALACLDDEERRRLHITWVGEGRLRTRVEQRLRDAGLKDTVSLPGAIPYHQLPAVYRSADVFLMPTLDDYRALVGFEALQYGLPLLHSIRDGACEEVVTDGDNGFQFDPRDRESFAARLKWFIANRSELSRMGMRSRERARCFTVQGAVDTLCAAIERCTARSGGERG